MNNINIPLILWFMFLPFKLVYAVVGVIICPVIVTIFWWDTYGQTFEEVGAEYTINLFKIFELP